MDRSNIIMMIVMVFSMGCTTTSSDVGTAAIIPAPYQQTNGNGYFSINRNTKILVENKQQAETFRLVFSSLKEKCGWMPKVLINQGKGDIIFSTDQAIKEEGYILSISKGNIFTFYIWLTLNHDFKNERKPPSRAIYRQ